jgi:hypothetical protein
MVYPALVLRLRSVSKKVGVYIKGGNKKLIFLKEEESNK